MSTRLGKKSMVGWISAVRPSRRLLSRPPQEEELSQYHQSPILILRSAQRARLEGRKAAMQPRRLNSCPASTQILPAASLRSADRLPASRVVVTVANLLICIALWSIGRVIFRVASNFLPALREGRASRRWIDQQPAGGDHRLGAVADTELAQDHRDVRLDGGFGDLHLMGDLLVEPPLRDHCEDLELLRRQRGEADAERDVRGPVGGCDMLGKPQIAGEHRADRLGKTLARCRFRNEAGGAVIKRAADRRRILAR